MKVLEFFKRFQEIFDNSYFKKPSKVSKLTLEERKTIIDNLNKVIFDFEDYRFKNIVDNPDVDYYIKASYALEFPAIFISMLSCDPKMSPASVSYDINRYQALCKIMSVISFLDEMMESGFEQFKRFIFLISENVFANLHTLARFYHLPNKSSFKNVFYDSIFSMQSHYERILTENEIFYLQNKETIDNFKEKVSNILNEEVAISYVSVLSNVIATSVLTSRFVLEDSEDQLDENNFYVKFRELVKDFGKFYVNTILSSDIDKELNDEKLVEIMLILILTSTIGVYVNAMNTVQDVNMRFVSLILEEFLTSSSLLVTIPKN